MNNKPLVSVVVTAYNSEAYLERCLDCLVNQTLKNIEIIIVNNGSTDNTLKIAEKYVSMYPKKIVIYTIEHHDRVGYGRNYGISKVRADYLASCDSDDYMEYNALEIMYTKAVEGNHDLVNAPYYYILNDKKKVVGRYKKLIEECTPENLILYSPFSFWSKLIHKEIFKKAGKVPEKYGNDDVAYIPVMLQYCKRPGHINKPLYHYLIRSDSETRDVFKLQTLEHMKAFDFMLERTSPDYINPVVMAISRRLWILLNDYWAFYDAFIKYYRFLKEKYIDKEPQLQEYAFIKRMTELSDTLSPKLISNNVYINGFGGADLSDRAAKLQKDVFYDGCSVYILDEKSCEITENKLIESAYNKADYGFVAAYFAMKNIYEKGGIYIGDCIKINAPLNCVKYNAAFFSYIDKHSFSEYIFGGVAGSRVFADILGSYKNENYPASTSDRIKNTLVSVYNVPLGNAQTFITKDICVYTPARFVCTVLSLDNKNVCEHDFSAKIGHKDYLVIKKNTLESIGCEYIQNAKESISVAQNNAIEKINRIRNSRSYKLMMVPLKPYRKARRSLKRIIKRGIRK